MRVPVVGAALVAGAVTSAALAETKPLARSGLWEAFGGTTSKGNPVCGISTGLDDGKYYGVKLFSGDKTFTIQLGWKEWKLEDKTKHSFTMRFDNNSPWRANGTGMHFDDGDAGLEITVNVDEVNQFNYEFKSSNRLYINFDTPGLASWNLSLQGTSAVSDAFQTCIRNMRSS